MNKIKLYHYVHCPFCVRVRIAFKYLRIEFESVVLSYDNEKTPLELTGVKMLPIVEGAAGAMNESLEIIKYHDDGGLIDLSIYLENKSDIDELLSNIGRQVHSLAMPYWIYTPEFDDISRHYFQTKKEKKRGPFNVLVEDRLVLMSKIDSILSGLVEDLQPFYKSKEFSLVDILLYSHLVGLYVVPGFHFPQKIVHYMTTIEGLTGFNYHEDFWRDNKPFRAQNRRKE